MKNLYKKISAVFFGLVFFCGITTLVFAQKTGDKTIRKIEAKTISGKVDSVSIAAPDQGVKSEIIVIDEKNKKISLIITSTTTMYGARSVPITLEKIKKGDRVKVKYATTTEGIDKAISVRIVP